MSWRLTRTIMGHTSTDLKIPGECPCCQSCTRITLYEGSIIVDCINNMNGPNNQCHWKQVYDEDEGKYKEECING